MKLHVSFLLVALALCCCSASALLAPANSLALSPLSGLGLPNAQLIEELQTCVKSLSPGETLSIQGLMNTLTGVLG
ncbi:uncharacterized protein LOC102384905 [Alligator sinensis]|uniref:Uncharacterized protein LOC102384905 n=1 Tax=Alligator sinensis TaxID=38654 RepID=A0A1U7SWE6_ALLSI|nr:uncharacterized protein LOC102384905 [Alligator sinensis]